MFCHIRGFVVILLWSNQWQRWFTVRQWSLWYRHPVKVAKTLCFGIGAFQGAVQTMTWRHMITQSTSTWATFWWCGSVTYHAFFNITRLLGHTVSQKGLISHLEWLNDSVWDPYVCGGCGCKSSKDARCQVSWFHCVWQWMGLRDLIDQLQVVSAAIHSLQQGRSFPPPPSWMDCPNFEGLPT